MQTFSKAWGLAGLRLGMGFASSSIIQILNKIKPPYNINTLTQNKASKALDNFEEKNEQVDVILSERTLLIDELNTISAIKHIYPSDANFLLVKIDNASHIYNKLVTQLIIVRNRSNVALCENCLRITVGRPEENKTLLAAIKSVV